MVATDRTRMEFGQTDRAESVMRSVDSIATRKTGISFFHVLALLSIFGSIALFLSGRRLEAIFVGLWPPTFEALKSAAENK